MVILYQSITNVTFCVNFLKNQFFVRQAAFFLIYESKKIKFEFVA
jgi:hypothetical protein